MRRISYTFVQLKKSVQTLSHIIAIAGSSGDAHPLEKFCTTPEKVAPLWKFLQPLWDFALDPALIIANIKIFIKNEKSELSLFQKSK